MDGQLILLLKALDVNPHPSTKYPLTYPKTL